MIREEVEKFIEEITPEQEYMVRAGSIVGRAIATGNARKTPDGWTDVELRKPLYFKRSEITRAPAKNGFPEKQVWTFQRDGFLWYVREDQFYIPPSVYGD